MGVHRHGMYLLFFNPISRNRELNTRREVPYLQQPYTIFYYVDTIGLNWQKKFDKRSWEFNGERFAIHSSTWQTGARGEWRVSSWLAISNKREKKLPLERSRVNSRLEGDTCTQLSKCKCFPHPIYWWVITIRNTWIPLSVEPKPHILPSDLLWKWRIDLSNPKKRKQHKTNRKKKKTKQDFWKLRLTYKVTGCQPSLFLFQYSDNFFNFIFFSQVVSSYLI